MSSSTRSITTKGKTPEAQVEGFFPVEAYSLLADELNVEPSGLNDKSNVTMASIVTVAGKLSDEVDEAAMAKPARSGKSRQAYGEFALACLKLLQGPRKRPREDGDGSVGGAKSKRVSVDESRNVMARYDEELPAMQSIIGEGSLASSLAQSHDDAASSARVDGATPAAPTGGPSRVAPVAPGDVPVSPPQLLHPATPRRTTHALDSEGRGQARLLRQPPHPDQAHFPFPIIIAPSQMMPSSALANAAGQPTREQPPAATVHTVTTAATASSEAASSELTEQAAEEACIEVAESIILGEQPGESDPCESACTCTCTCTCTEHTITWPLPPKFLSRLLNYLLTYTHIRRRHGSIPSPHGQAGASG